jgi:ammonia channel protein AmtB
MMRLDTPADSGQLREAHVSLYTFHPLLSRSISWYGFNAGSTLMVSGGTSAVAAKVCVCDHHRTLSAASAVVTCTIFSRVVHKTEYYDLMLLLNGVLAGLVLITTNCMLRRR